MHEAENGAQPTPFREVNAVVGAFLAEIRAVLGSSFVGMYLYGSLAQGGFDRDRSDIDFIVITAHDVTTGQFAMLDAMHRDFRASTSYWAGKIEAAYIQKDALNGPGSSSARYPQLEKGRELAREPLEIGWAFQRAILRDQGITLAGPDPATLLEPVAARALSATALAVVRMWQEARRSDPSWLGWVRQRQEHSFVLVTLSRSLYTLEQGTLASKSAAARWARATLEGRWASLVARSLAARGGGDEVSDQDLAETLAFVDYTAQCLADSLAG